MCAQQIHCRAVNLVGLLMQDWDSASDPWKRTLISRYFNENDLSDFYQLHKQILQKFTTNLKCSRIQHHQSDKFWLRFPCGISLGKIFWWGVSLFFVFKHDSTKQLDRAILLGFFENLRTSTSIIQIKGQSLTHPKWKGILSAKWKIAFCHCFLARHPAKAPQHLAIFYCLVHRRPILVPSLALLHQNQILSKPQLLSRLLSTSTQQITIMEKGPWNTRDQMNTTVSRTEQIACIKRLQHSKNITWVGIATSKIAIDLMAVEFSQNVHLDMTFLKNFNSPMLCSFCNTSLMWCALDQRHYLIRILPLQSKRMLQHFVNGSRKQTELWSQKKTL